MSHPRIVLECLSGPLDGYQIILEDDTIWGKAGPEPMQFPWDTELEDNQARFLCEGGSWWLESSHNRRHGTYRLTTKERIENRIRLDINDILKASDTYLLVKHIE